MFKRYFIIVSIFLFLITSCEKEKRTIGVQIDGDFNGDGKNEIATLEYVNAKKVGDAILFEYSISFNDLNIKPIKLENSFRKLQLINEGDLNNDNADDISISYEIHPSIPFSSMETRSFDNNKWNYLITDFIIHLGFETINSDKLQEIVTKQGDSIIYETYSESLQFDENFKPLKNKKIKKVISLK